MVTVADRASRPVLYFRIEGCGPDSDPAGTAEQYRFSTVDPGSGISGGPVSGTWRPYLVDVPQALSTEIDVVTGATKIGSTSVMLQEGSSAAAPFLT